MARRASIAVISAVVLTVAGTLSAHHSISAEFDQSKPVTFTGIIKQVDWMNPHIYTHVETKGPDGKMVVYKVEGGPPNSLFRQGWRKDTLKPGTVVQVSGSRAKKAESNRVNGSITMPDGRVFARGNANPTAQQ